MHPAALLPPRRASLLVGLLLAFFAMAACAKTPPAASTFYVLTHDVKPGDKLSRADLAEVGYKQPPGVPDLRTLILHPGNIEPYLGQPFTRRAGKDEPLTADMFVASASIPTTTTAAAPSFRLNANPQRLAALGLTLADFSNALQQLLAEGKPLTPDSPVTIGGKTYRLSDLADFGGP